MARVHESGGLKFSSKESADLKIGHYRNYWGFSELDESKSFGFEMVLSVSTLKRL